MDQQRLSLKSFSNFESTTDAVTAVEGLVEGKLSKDLKKFLEKEFSKNKKDALLVGDTRLGIYPLPVSLSFFLRRSIRSKLTSH